MFFASEVSFLNFIMDGIILKSFNLPRPRLICIYKLFDVEMKCTAASVVENLSLFSLSLAPNDALLHSKRVAPLLNSKSQTRSVQSFHLSSLSASVPWFQPLVFRGALIYIFCYAWFRRKMTVEMAAVT